MAIFEVIFFIGIMLKSTSSIMQDWTYELQDIAVEVKTPDLIDIDLQVKQLGRGKFAIAGHLNTLKPLNDELFVEVTVDRSATGSSDWKTQPFKIQRDTLTKILNGPYKQFLMPSLKECAPKAPQFQTFVAPLPASNIAINNCNLDTQFLPTHMQEGFYRLNVILSGQIDAKVQVFVKIEPKMM